MKPLFLFLSFTLLSVFTFAQDCASITITGGNGQINITGVSGAPIAGVQVFNSSWASVYNQTYNNPSGSITVTPMPVGTYFVNVRLYNSNWGIICEKGANATVTNTPPPPPPPTDVCGATFQKTFGTAQGNEAGHNMIKSSDGGYIAIGQAAVNGTTNHDALIMKFDNNGSLLWSKTLGGPQVDYFSHAVPTPDGGCVVGGATNSNGDGTFTGDSWLVRFDGSGNVLWQKRHFLSGSSSQIFALTALSDGGFAFIGSLPLNPGVSDWMIVKTDANGNAQWYKELGSNNSDVGSGIIEDNNGTPGLIISGNIYSGSSWYDAVISKLDMNGNVLWTKAYDFDSRANWTGPIYKVSDGLIFNTINADGYGSENSKPAIMKTDFNGTVIWVKEYTVPNGRDARITVLPDEGFMMVQSELPHDAASDMHLIRIDKTGNIMWAKKYPRPGAQFLYGLASDGDYVAGAGISTAGSYNDLLLTKADLNGKIGTCSTVNVTATTRTSVVTSFGFNWTINGALPMTTANTSYTLTTTTPVENVLCADVCPAVTVSNATVNENAGTASVQVCLASPAANAITYSYTTSNGTATSGSDFTGGSGTVTIAAGQTCGTITIPILNDAITESAEAFTVTVGSATGTVTINDDDQPQGNCDGVTITPGSNLITVTGVTAPVATVQVFNSSWASVFSQTYTNSPGTVNVPIGPGTYLVKVTFYTANWGYICDKSENVTVINQCPAGMICISNICPSPTVNLNDAYSIPNLPAGTTVSWHTGTPATDANKLTAEQAQNVSASGTYYAAIHISGGCYSATIAVSVTINPCSAGAAASKAVTNAVQLKSADVPTARNIMAFPNPFTRSLRVVIDSEKKEKATLMLMDLQGRPLKQLPVQLSPGSNNVLIEGLDQFPSGNYFLRISSDSGTRTLKVMRQQ
jgi:hypothetical protein